MSSSNPPLDATLRHAWFADSPPPHDPANNQHSKSKGVHGTTSPPRKKKKGEAIISEDGLNNIAHHKYKSGQYTRLDTLFNPMWTSLTELLPMWMAPNMVTTLGGLHCAASYAALWCYSYNFDRVVPDWTIFLSAYCTFAYYTLDCMDGKQSRRTGTSSPLGQLFDHGFDCICNLSHLSNIAGITMLGNTPAWYFVLQGSLQFSFFMAQWEEYYTGVLPHAVGDFGVTEVNYGIAVLTFANGFVDREVFWTRRINEILPTSALLDKAFDINDELSYYLQKVMDMELRHFVFALWISMICFLVASSFSRVFRAVDTNAVRLSATSKLLTPAALACMPFVIPVSYRTAHIRKISVATGLMFSLLTKKMIVFSMARMAFATVQFDAVIPYFLLCAWLRFDSNITPLGARMLLRGVCVYHALRLLRWCNVVIDQICDRLDIYCFTIKKKKKDTKDE